MRLGAFETGGTKMVCAVGDENGQIQDRMVFPTTTPDETMPEAIGYFRRQKLDALGIACFGPIDLRRESDTYGYILETPKTAWRNYDIVGEMRKTLRVPIGFDTDVNGALLGEATWGGAKGLTDAVYLTIGTGIGGGVMAGGKLLHGMLHPEIGHMRLAAEPGDIYPGKCSCHGACFEGLASGPAIEERYGKRGEQLAGCPEVWELESSYIAQALVTLIMTLSPQRIILGGGVMQQTQLFALIREKVTEYINGYLKTKELQHMDSYIVPAALAGDQGILGALRLAALAAAGQEA